MNISIQGHHIQVTDAMNQAVMEKLSKVERHTDMIQSLTVILSLDNRHSSSSQGGQNSHKAEAILRVAGNEMVVHACSDDMYHAIGDMADKLDRQVRKHKTKISKKSRSLTRRARQAMRHERRGDDMDAMLA